MDDPTLPTAHPPGSPGKLEVLTQRAALDLPLFLEGDELGGRKSCSLTAGPALRKNNKPAKEAAALRMRAEGRSQRHIAAAIGCSVSHVNALLRQRNSA